MAIAMLLILFGEPGWDRTIDHLIKSYILPPS